MEKILAGVWTALLCLQLAGIAHADDEGTGETKPPSLLVLHPTRGLLEHLTLLVIS